MNKKETIDAATAARELTLALLFLNRFREKVGPNSWTPWRAWKGFDFDTLDNLAESGFISSTRTAKSVSLTDEGLAEARHLLEKFGIADWPKLEGKGLNMSMWKCCQFQVQYPIGVTASGTRNNDIQNS